MTWVNAVCSVDGCDEIHYGKGFCKLHYKRDKAGIQKIPCVVCGAETFRAGAKYCSAACRMKWHRKNGCYRDEEAKRLRGVCSVDGCDGAIHAYSMCRAHSKKLWKYGDPLVVKRKPRIEHCVKCGKQRPKTGTANGLCHRCYHNAYYHANVETERPRRNARRSRLKRVTPVWADLEAIRQFYAECPKGHEVDHVIPIRGRRVTGLHVRDNLQYLRVVDNRKKSNTFA